MGVCDFQERFEILKFWYWTTINQYYRDNIAAEVSARPESKRV